MEFQLASLNALISPAISSLAIGALTCFMGYRLRNVWVAVAGFVVGFLAGEALCARFLSSGSAAAVGLIIGLVLTLVCIWLYDVGMFVLCGGCALLFLYPYLAALALPDYLIFALLAVVFVAAGLLARKFMKTVLIVITSFAGGSTIASSLAALGIPYISAAGSAGIICTLVFAFIGVVVQFSGAKGK